MFISSNFWNSSLATESLSGERRRGRAYTGRLQSPYQGPFKVIDRQGKFYKLDLGTRPDTVSIDRLKPAFLEEATDAIEPRRPAHAAEVRSPTRPNHSRGAVHAAPVAAWAVPF